jgi:Zn-finger nucleic acid-binding protein
MICPVCNLSHEQPAAQVEAVAVCPNCGASYVIDGTGETRRATIDDTTALTESERQTLRKSRGRTR